MAHSSTDKPNETVDRTLTRADADSPGAVTPPAVSPEQQPTRDFPAVGGAPTSDTIPDAVTAPPSALAADLIRAFGDRYELGTHVGSGGFGSVFRALDRRLNRRVAMKASRAASTDPERQLREARALAQLSHPGIVAVFDVAVAGRYCFVVSELLPGPSLSEWLDDNRPAPAEAVRIAAAVADALAHAHARSIIHRDVKPSNVVFADGLRPVLVDFGLALSEMDSAAERGVVSGTPSYMSPEQAGGRAHRPDGRTDVYGLAATLYTMLCGRHPFRGRTSAEVLRQVLEDEPQPPRQLRAELPPELERVCLKGMAKLPGDRYTTAADFAEALRRSVGPRPAPEVSVPPPPRSTPAAPLSASSSPAAPSSSRGPRAERRHVTLLHGTCEAGGADDDPMEQVAAFQAVCADVVAAQGGLALQATGAAFLACFGYPVAREDAPRRAVRAALEICHRAGTLPVLAAVGTGPAVVTETPGTPPVVVGDVATAAAALAAQGAHTGVVITDPTFRLVDAYFDCEPAGEVKPRGAAAVPVHRVTAERAVRNRLDAANSARLTPLVGRDREVALLRERWESAAEGVRNVILLVADPGLGKSRLVRVMKDIARGADPAAAPSDSSRTDSASAAVVEWYCSPYHQDSPFYPVTDYFDRAYQLSREPDPAARLDRLLDRLRADGVSDPEDQALFAAVLSVPGGDRLPALALSPERQKEKTQAALLDWLTGRAERAAVLFVVEDLHWVDPSTEALLADFVQSGGDARVLGLFTFRPEYHPPWKGGAVQTQVALNRLTRGQVGELIRAQAGDAVISQESAEQIAERTDGVPLFVEEFTRLAADGGGVGGVIPATLQDLLLARLDRMASAGDVIQLGAVIGRTFSYGVIRAASMLDDELLRAELEKLVAAGLLFPKGPYPRTTYTFKHALIQDAAYQSLVKKQRQQFHRTVAAALERVFPDVPVSQPELLAHHSTEAGDTAQGIAYWLRAGLRGRERSAHAEAIRHLARGLALVAAGPEGAARDAEELQFRMPLTASYIAVRGYAAAEVEEHIQRARALCERLGPPSPLFHVLMIIWALRFIRGHSVDADATSRELLALAELEDDSYKAEACWTASATAWWAGDFARAAEFSRRGVACYTVETSRPHGQILQQNCGPLMTSYVAWALFVLGESEQAERWQAQALALAEELADKFSIVVTQWQYGFFTALIRDPRRAAVFADAVVATSREESYAFWLALGIGLKGTALVLDGRHADAIPLLRDGVAKCDAIGSGILHTTFLGDLAEALWRTGDRVGAWAALNRALEHNDRLGQRAQEAELKRRRALFLLDESPHDTAAAEAVLADALATARGQRTRVFELRAALALGGVWSASGRAEAARELVAGVLAAFTEGAGAPDLTAARAFLKSLA